MGNIKKLLTLDDLYNFYYKQNKNCTFNAKDSGYQVSVQIPSKFEIAENKDDSLLFCKVKVMHSGVNRNHSCVTDDALKEASKSLAYKPILANFMEYTDEITGETLKDFTSHDMVVNDDGSIEYIEKQIGCFTADEPYFEVEKETGHNFLYGYCAIPKDYTDASSIIERKGGTKVSVELSVNEMQYSAKSKVLELTDITITGLTCLGRNPETNEEVGEGMLNARLDIVDFSTENNSLFTNYDNTIIEMQDRLNKLESVCFNIDNSKKGGNQVDKTIKENFEEEVTVEEVTETEEATKEEVTVTENESEDTVVDNSEEANDVEVETEMETESKESNSVIENENDAVEDDDEEDGKDKADDDDDETEKVELESEDTNTLECSYSLNGEVKKFAVSLDDKIYALQDLVNSTYADADNTWYSTTVYADYLIMNDWCNNRYFKQTYTDENDVYTLTGDRIEVFAEFVTKKELDELDNMRANYSTLVEFKKDVESKELHAQKEAILNDTKYSVLEKNEKFAELVKNMDNYSFADLETNAKIIFADYVAEVGTFSMNEEKTSSIKLFGNPNSKKKKNSRYGDLFKK